MGAQEPRRVHIYTLEVQAWPEHEILTIGDRVSVLVECSSGTYIRQLAADIGERLSVGSHSSLSVSKSAILTRLLATRWKTWRRLPETELCLQVLPISAGLSHLPTVILTEDDINAEKRSSSGTPVEA